MRAFLDCPRSPLGKLLGPTLLSLLMVSVVLLAFPLTAKADDSTEARVLYQKGLAAFRGGDDVMARHYYTKSLEKEHSFDTICNLGRTEARMKRFEDAYFHLSLCERLYPEDKELAEAKAQYAGLRDEVKTELTEEQTEQLDVAVAAWVPPGAGVSSGLEAEPAPVEPEAAPRKNKWKWPVVISVGTAGVVGAVVGGVLLGKASGLQGDAEELRDPNNDSACAGDTPAGHCSELESTLKKADSTKNAGVGVLAAGSALVLGAVVLAIVVPNERATVALGRTNVVLGMPSLIALPTGEFQVGLQGKF